MRWTAIIPDHARHYRHSRCTRDANAAAAMLTALAGPENSDDDDHRAAIPARSPTSRVSTGICRRRATSSRIGRWMGGRMAAIPSRMPPQKGISSFTAIDLLLLYLGDKAHLSRSEGYRHCRSRRGRRFCLALCGAGPGAGSARAAQDIRALSRRQCIVVSLFHCAAAAGGQSRASVCRDAKKCADYNNYQYGLAHLNAYAQAQRRRCDSPALSLAACHYAGGPARTATIPFPDTSCAALLAGCQPLDARRELRGFISTRFSATRRDKTQSFATIRRCRLRSGRDVRVRPCGMSVLFGEGDLRAVRN